MVRELVSSMCGARKGLPKETHLSQDWKDEKLSSKKTHSLSGMAQGRQCHHQGLHTVSSEGVNQECKKEKQEEEERK